MNGDIRINESKKKIVVYKSDLGQHEKTETAVAK